MRQRTLILRLWRDAAGDLKVQVNDPVSELRARFANSQELWSALETWFAASPMFKRAMENKSDARSEEKRE